MRDFPFFSTEYGVASITLREIPYTRQGYIWVQTVQKGSLLRHLKECAQFCRAAGAERVFAANHPGLKQFKSYFTLLQLRLWNRRFFWSRSAQKLWGNGVNGTIKKWQWWTEPLP